MRGLGRPGVPPRVLLRHVEHGGEKCLHSSLRQWSAVGVDELPDEGRLALGIDHGRPRPALVLVDTNHELEAPIQRPEQRPIDLLDLSAELL